MTPDQNWTIAATGDTQTVDNISCHRFEFVNRNLHGTDTSDVWISDVENILVPDFHRAFYNIAFMLTGHETLVEGLKKVCGFPMLTDYRSTSHRTSKIVVIDTVNVDSTFFSLPATFEESSRRRNLCRAKNDNRAAEEIGVPVAALSSPLEKLNSNPAADEVTNE